MTRGGKRFYATFINDFSRYIKIYLQRNKDKVGEKFLDYENKVENQLRMKKKRTNEGGEYKSSMFNAFL